MILVAYMINELAVGAEIPVWRASEIGDNAPFKLVDTVPSGYKDITSITNLHSFGHATDRDFKAVRDEMKQHVIFLGATTVVSNQNDPNAFTPNVGDRYRIIETALDVWAGKEGYIAEWDGSNWIYYTGEGIATPEEEVGFSLLSADDKRIAAAHLIGTIPQQVAAYGSDIEEKQEDQSEYNEKVTECRRRRFLWAQTYFMNQIPLNAAQVLGVIETYKFDKRYVEQGIFGQDEFDDIAPGICDYLDGVAVFDNAGIRQETWTTLYGANMNIFCDAVKNVLVYEGLKNS